MRRTLESCVGESCVGVAKAIRHLAVVSAVFATAQRNAGRSRRQEWRDIEDQQQHELRHGSRFWHRRCSTTQAGKTPLEECTPLHTREPGCANGEQHRAKKWTYKKKGAASAPFCDLSPICYCR